MNVTQSENAAKFLISDIPDALRLLRKQHGLTLATLSQRCGLSVSYLSDIERGRTQPSLESLNAIVAALDYHVVFQLERSEQIFEMFGHVEVQVLYALERRDFGRALGLIAALMGYDFEGE